MNICQFCLFFYNQLPNSVFLDSGIKCTLPAAGDKVISPNFNSPELVSKKSTRTNLNSDANFSASFISNYSFCCVLLIRKNFYTKQVYMSATIRIFYFFKKFYLFTFLFGMIIDLYICLNFCRVFPNVIL